MLSQVFFQAFGLAVFAALVSWAWSVRTRRWRLLAVAYAGSPERLGAVGAVRHMQALIFRGAGPAWESHQGITRVAVHERGLAFSLMFPFGIGAPPIAIPFADLTAETTDWYLNAESIALTARRCPELEIIVDAELMQWIEKEAADRWQAGYSLLHRVQSRG